MKNNNIKYVNHEKILITDFLPYEVPLMYTNDNFYLYIKKRKNYYRKQLNDFKQKHTIPLKYQSYVRKDKNRELSLINPYGYLNIIKYLIKYEEILLSDISQNNVSLRYQTKGKEEVKRKTYYSIKKFKRVYEFENSQYFLNLQYENKFFSKIDIKSCFDSIYTHSFKWIISDDFEISTNVVKNTYLGKLDTLLQQLNGGKTNGILIGPEFFRFSAEVLLANIDKEIKKELEEKELKVTIKRFIDYYFIFSNSEETLDKTEKIIEITLKKYLLNLNEHKKIRKREYFVLNNWYINLSNLSEQIDIKDVHNLKTQRKIMSIISEHQSDRDTILTFIISTITRKTQKSIETIRNCLQSIKHEGDAYRLSDEGENFFLDLMKISKEQFEKEYIENDKLDIDKILENLILNEKFQNGIFRLIETLIFYVKVAPKYQNYIKLLLISLEYCTLINDEFLNSCQIPEKKIEELKVKEREIKDAVINAFNKKMDYQQFLDCKLETSNILLIFEYFKITLPQEILKKYFEDSKENPLYIAILYRYLKGVENPELNELSSDVEKHIKQNIKQSINNNNFNKKEIWYIILFKSSKELRLEILAEQLSYSTKKFLNEKEIKVQSTNKIISILENLDKALADKKSEDIKKYKEELEKIEELEELKKETLDQNLINEFLESKLGEKGFFNFRQLNLQEIKNLIIQINEKTEREMDY